MANNQNLQEIRQTLTKAINAAKKQADNALKSGIIDDSKWQKAKDEWGEWETIESYISGMISDEQLNKILKNDPNSLRSQIEQATNRLNKSAGKIEDLNNFFSEINSALKFFSNINAILPIV
ncbi:hypothetical protein [Nostoc sp. ChiVER01]|uniref:hypothetical protein n=1 Tax=Nostoc sp. ChiVER01 TaxID=3075382 RepID=UPI002AD4E8AC|nr:hypothetical protein [Nostoc sp. ChiVER01]MDZ8225113.1 hypothetical protein [Nostoc sp. ChiVER01]